MRSVVDNEIDCTGKEDYIRSASRVAQRFHPRVPLSCFQNVGKGRYQKTRHQPSPQLLCRQNQGK